MDTSSDLVEPGAGEPKSKNMDMISSLSCEEYLSDPVPLEYPPSILSRLIGECVGPIQVKGSNRDG